MAINTLQDRVVAITGASSGVGKATAEHLAAAGARLVVAARKAERLERVADDIRSRGGQAMPFVVDVTRAEDVAGMVSAAEREYGHLDVMVMNAGIGPVAPLDTLKVDEWNQMVDVNLKGVLNSVAAALPTFRRQGSGHFVGVASVAGMTPTPGMAVYGATKVAVRVVLEGLRVEAGPHLRVTSILPGFVDTDFVSGTTDTAFLATLTKARDAIAIPPAAIAAAIEYAISQPAEVDVNEIIVRPSGQR